MPEEWKELCDKMQHEADLAYDASFGQLKMADLNRLMQRISAVMLLNSRLALRVGEEIAKKERKRK